MKILVLMPLDEKWVYMANGLYNSLPVEVRDKTFAMPMFMQYCITTKSTPNWLYATFDALVAVKSVYNAAKDGDLIIIGNCDKDMKFDAIFNFQDIEVDLPYEDKLMEKTREIVKSDKELLGYTTNLYTNEDSIMPLHNIVAAADFLAAYLDTDPKIEQIRKQYQEKVNFKDYVGLNKDPQA